MATGSATRGSASHGKGKGKGTRSRKRVVKDETVKAILAVRDQLLEKANTADEKEAIHMACKGLFACPKGATEAEKKKCFDGVKGNLKKLGGMFGGGRRRASRRTSRRSRTSRKSSRRTSRRSRS